MNAVIVRSYYRSILRGTRTIDEVPEELQDAVRDMLSQQ